MSTLDYKPVPYSKPIMASKETNQISIRLDDDINKAVDVLRQAAIEEQLKIREEVGAERFDAQFGKPTPPTRSELCKRVLQGAIRSMAASPGGVTVDV